MFFIGVVYITIKMKKAKWCDTFKIGKCKVLKSIFNEKTTLVF